MEMFYVNTKSKGNQIKTKRYKFSLVSDAHLFPLLIAISVAKFGGYIASYST